MSIVCTQSLAKFSSRKIYSSLTPLILVSTTNNCSLRPKLIVQIECNKIEVEVVVEVVCNRVPFASNLTKHYMCFSTGGRG